MEITRGPAKLDHSADTRPQIVVDRAGRVTVGYAVMTDVQFQGEIFHAHSRDGRAFSAPRPVSANPAGKRFLSLALDPAGAVFAAWVDKRDLAAAKAAGRQYAGAAVYAAWSRDGGATFGDPVTIREHTCECCRVAVDFAGAGRPVVLWRNLFGKARDHAITTFTAPGDGRDGPPDQRRRLGDRCLPASRSGPRRGARRHVPRGLVHGQRHPQGTVLRPLR